MEEDNKFNNSNKIKFNNSNNKQIKLIITKTNKAIIIFIIINNNNNNYNSSQLLVKIHNSSKYNKAFIFLPFRREITQVLIEILKNCKNIPLSNIMKVSIYPPVKIFQYSKETLLIIIIFQIL